MPYDYDSIVSSITSFRKEAYQNPDAILLEPLNKAVEECSKLSTLCPLPPLLWLHYANDARQAMLLLLKEEEGDDAMDMNVDKESTKVRLGIFELGISEFPGCALLRLRYLKDLVFLNHNNDEEVISAFEDAISCVGNGTHRSDDDVDTIWNMYIDFTYHSSLRKEGFSLKDAKKAVANLFVKKAKLPLDSNSSLNEDISNWKFDLSNDIIHGCNLSLSQVVEEGRRHASKVYDKYAPYESEVQCKMNEECILEEFPDRYLMGLGASGTASAFVTYAKVLSSSSKSEEGDHTDLSLNMYERAVSECPTVEDVWIPYIHSLIRLNHKKVLTVCDRSVRNCPFSTRLFALQMRCMIQYGMKEFDAEPVLNVAKEAVENGFLPSVEAQVEVYLEACRVIRRQLMSHVSQYAPMGERYDDDLPVKQQPNQNKRKECDEEEANFLVEDLREAYDTVDDFIKQQHSSWSYGRSLLGRERALVESYVIRPILSAQEDYSSVRIYEQEANLRFDKLCKIYPSSGQSWKDYISFAMHSYHRFSYDLYRNLRKVRTLYRKAIKVVSTEEGLASICNDYLSFERVFGSCDSLAKATALTKSPLRDQKRAEWEANTESSTTTQKRKIDHDTVSDTNNNTDTKRQKQNEKKPINLKIPKNEDDETPKHILRINNIDYPAHPYTIQISNLSPTSTQDMDLVDAFKSFGTIVHARILRQKGKGGKSKGMGLVQFQKVDSVEKALGMDEEIGIHEHLVKIARSHMAAVSIVPPGMHRVKPKGEGRSTKRNKKRANKATTNTKDEKDHDGTLSSVVPDLDKQKDNNNNDDDDGDCKMKDVSSTTPISNDSTIKTQTDVVKEKDHVPSKPKNKPNPVTKSDVLAFRPRGVVTHPKKKRIKIHKTR